MRKPRVRIKKDGDLWAVGHGVVWYHASTVDRAFAMWWRAYATRRAYAASRAYQYGYRVV